MGEAILGTADLLFPRSCMQWCCAILQIALSGFH